MRLASLKEGRDGALILVSRDFSKAVRVPEIAGTLQEALDDWENKAPQLQAVCTELCAGKRKDAFAFDPKDCAAPLPRAYQWADGSAYVNHVELVRKARGAEMPDSFWTDPLMYQGGSDSFIGPCDPISIENPEWGIDFESELGVVTDDVPMGVTAEDALQHIKLITILNDVSLRNLIPAELGKGFGFFQSKPATAFAPVMVTLDELGDAWRGGRVYLPLRTWLNGKLFGEPEAGEDMTFHFGQLIAHAAKSRHLGAGSIIGSGTVSNKDRSKGSSCLAERRMLEIIDHGKAETPFMQFGDRVRIEMQTEDGRSLFGAIDQEVCQYVPATPVTS